MWGMTKKGMTTLTCLKKTACKNILYAVFYFDLLDTRNELALPLSAHSKLHLR